MGQTKPLNQVTKRGRLNNFEPDYYTLTKPESPSELHKQDSRKFVRLSH